MRAVHFVAIRLAEHLLLRRAGALVIDRLASLALVLGGALVARSLTHAHQDRAGVVVLASALGLATAYAWARDAFDGRSLGRRLFALRVVDRTTGMPIGALRSLLREVTLHLPPLTLAELVVVWIAPGLRIGDLCARTKVVDARTDAEVL